MYNVVPKPQTQRAWPGGSTDRASLSNSQTKIIVLDATKASFTDIEKALESTKIKELNVTVLINNVGGLGAIFTKHFKTFAEYMPAEIDSVFAINNHFMTYLTSLMMPILSSSGGRTLIINLGSLAEAGTPYQTLYCTVFEIY